MDGAGHSAGVQRVDYAEGGLEVAVGDARLCALRDQIENGSACRFGTGSCGCGDSDEREQLGWNGETFAERCIDEVEEVGI